VGGDRLSDSGYNGQGATKQKIRRIERVKLKGTCRGVGSKGKRGAIPAGQGREMLRLREDKGGGDSQAPKLE